MKTKSRKTHGLTSEYHFDYKKAKPNRFAKKMKNEPVIVLLDKEGTSKKSIKPLKKKTAPNKVSKPVKKTMAKKKKK